MPPSGRLDEAAAAKTTCAATAGPCGRDRLAMAFRPTSTHSGTPRRRPRRPRRRPARSPRHRPREPDSDRSEQFVRSGRAQPAFVVRVQPTGPMLQRRTDSAPPRRRRRRATGSARTRASARVRRTHARMSGSPISPPRATLRCARRRGDRANAARLRETRDETPVQRERRRTPAVAAPRPCRHRVHIRRCATGG